MMRTDYVIDAANRLIERTGTRNPREICRQMGVCLYDTNLKNQLKGLYFTMYRQKVIVIDGNETEEMQNMLIAHELGHSILHRHSPSPKGYHLFETDETNIEEREANLFAAELLLEKDTVMGLLRDYSVSQAAAIEKVPVQVMMLKLQIMQRYDNRIKDVGTVKSTFLKD